MKTVAIIQGRMSSRRLPGKILEDIAGMPLLAHVIRRAKAAGVFDEVIVATSLERSDDPVQDFCKTTGVSCFRGNLNDVLDRYYQAAKYHGADRIARLTGDCPLLDPAVIRRVVDALDSQYDYVSNVLHRSFPKGLDTEVFSIQTLTRVWEQARLPSEREHVTPFIYKNPTLFRIGEVTQKPDHSALRWTVDEPRDLDFVRAVFGQLGNGIFGQEKILDLLAVHPEIQKLNEGIDPDEGYRRSLQQDAAQSAHARMKLLFRTDGSASIGLGHVMRCLALAQAAHCAGHSASFLMAPGAEAAEERLRAEQCDVRTLAAKPGTPQDAAETAAIARDQAADWVIVDGYQFDGNYQQTFKEGGMPLLFIDDFGHANRYVADIILNQNFYASEMHYASSGISRLLLGPEYALLRREFVQWKRLDRIFPEHANRILITMGGADTNNNAEKILQCLQNIDKMKLDITIVSGAANPHRTSLEKTIEKSCHTARLLFNVTNMAPLMAESDVGITAGGSTCYETLFMGLPSVVFVTADNQERNVQSLERAHAIIGAGWDTALNERKLPRLLASVLSDEELRRSLSTKGRGIVDGQGCSRVLSVMQHGSRQ